MDKRDGEFKTMDKTHRAFDLEKLLFDASADVVDFESVVCIRMHFYAKEVNAMMVNMQALGFRLVSVLHVEHRLCSGSGREFWWYKISHTL